MTNHPNRNVPVHGHARRAFPGDAIYIMARSHIDMQGREWPKGTEYTPLSVGVANPRAGSPTVQTVTIGNQTVEFRGRDNAIA